MNLKFNIFITQAMEDEETIVFSGFDEKLIQNPNIGILHGRKRLKTRQDPPTIKLEGFNEAVSGAESRPPSFRCLRYIQVCELNNTIDRLLESYLEKCVKLSRRLIIFKNAANPAVLLRGEQHTERRRPSPISLYITLTLSTYESIQEHKAEF